MTLRVLSAGTHSLVVDRGRPRSRALGVPVGGPADSTAFALGNALLGNSIDAPALELTLAGPALRAVGEVGLCVFGAPFQLFVDEAPVLANHSFTLRDRQVLRIGGTASGCRAYLCVVGGFHAPRVLDSVSAFEPIVAGNELACATSTRPGRGIEWFPSHVVEIRCLPGPQADWFDATFFENTYRVQPASNRMGVRLDGPPLILPKRELVSEPVAPGAVQITNDGRPIVLGVDGQTIGGYPKIAHVVSADLDALGQLRPGAEVRFRLVIEDEAARLATAKRFELRAMLRRIALGLGDYQ